MEKGNKRKRLAKACDACHKSKRRCDGTSPCSNCYYASKTCTYTDSSGRPVPAPRRELVEEEESFKRPRHDEPGLMAFSPFDPPKPPSLDPSTIRELTNIFFTHCHPASIIIHRSSFTSSLVFNMVPPHLLHAICAVAACYSHQPSLRTTPQRLAGQRFADQTRRMLFDVSEDGTRKLSLSPTLATAQTLMLLLYYEWTTQRDQRNSSSGTSSLSIEWYREQTLSLIQTLNVHTPEHPLVTPSPSQAYVQGSIERECLRRIFWLIYMLDCIRSIFYRWEEDTGPRDIITPGASQASEVGLSYTVSPYPTGPPRFGQSATSVAHPRLSGVIGFSEGELRLRLPADETSFELGMIHESLPEFLFLPGTRSSFSSELGHMIRSMTIYQKIEATFNSLLEDPQRHIRATGTGFSAVSPSISLDGLTPVQQVSRTFLAEHERQLDEWHQSLPSHLIFSSANLEMQCSMFMTPSNTGAWCWVAMHAFQAASILALSLAKEWIESRSPSSSRLHTSSSQLDRDRVTAALEKHEALASTFGDRIGKSMLVGIILWPILKYCPASHPRSAAWLKMYEDLCGNKMDEIVRADRRQWIDGGRNIGLGRTSRSHGSSVVVIGPPASSHTPPREDGPIDPRLLGGASPGASSSTSTSVHEQSQMLPSLKSSGLLEWNHREQNHREHPVSSTGSVPVGLPWLASERL